MKKKEYIIPAVEIFTFESEHIATMSRFGIEDDGGEDQVLTNKRQENWPQKQGWSNPAPWEE